MTHSEHLDKLADALATFQAGLKPVTRNIREDGESYADIAAVRKHVQKRLKQNGLSVIQWAGLDGVTTMLLHVSGQWVCDSSKSEPRADGDVAYGARYALMTVLGVVQAAERRTTAVMVQSRLSASDTTAAGELMRNLGLSIGQQTVLLRKYSDLEGLTAEAQKMAGAK